MLTHMPFPFAGFLVDDVSTGAQFRHHPHLGLLAADTPARNKLGLFLGVNAYIPCPLCFFQGCHYPAVGKGMYYAGYNLPSSQGLEMEPTSIMASDAMRRDHDTSLDMAHAVEAGDIDPSQAGCNGLSPLVEFIPQFDYVNGFQIPVAHALIHGVVKSFWQACLRKMKRGQPWPEFVISHEGRRLMTLRAALLIVTHEFGRPYRDIVTKMGNYVMEDWIHWLETYSLFIARGVLPPDIWQMWLNLRAAALHYVRQTETSDDPTVQARAAQDPADYSRLVDEVS